MSAAKDSSNIRLPLEKKPSITEDLHLNISEQSQNKENILYRSKLKTIEEEKNEKVERGLIEPNPAETPATSAMDKKSMEDKSGTNKTLAELTQGMKGELNKIIQEINNSDTEFERIMSDIEKQIADLRLKIGTTSSK
ncbi:hypothetical protein CANINC_002757 [Pichia inconspicua]|uniref:Uncharacterized protein n=1 Tax=Pichia inconspicua TaxID=52247 RepID=A0A4T0X0G7_9ASCO|nr:hypothetical protein CANINC_002757 [[Candida] inconspicua]